MSMTFSKRGSGHALGAVTLVAVLILSLVGGPAFAGPGDRDRDGLKNVAERRNGTDVRDADTDDDGIDDGDEVRVLDSDPLDADENDNRREDGDDNWDGDGVDNEDEDDVEESCRFDDLDSEGDGVDDEDENEFGSDADDPDSDEDGVLDGFEDYDGDGVDSMDESQGVRGKDDCGSHGAAVSTVAKCPVKGRAKGQLVKTIARDKQATVEDAVAACAEALAAAQASQTEPVGEDQGTVLGERVEKGWWPFTGIGAYVFLALAIAAIAASVALLRRRLSKSS